MQSIITANSNVYDAKGIAKNSAERQNLNLSLSGKSRPDASL
ncbi:MULTISPECIES: hypothetical protein [unclassified Pseudanabaena]|nr:MULTISPECIES: hypothetical protein [unclassified Pseudanabaena]